MSVSNNINTDNQIPQSAVGEVKKWRCTKMNDGEQHGLAVVSPQQNTTGEGLLLSRLRENEEIIPKTSSIKVSVPTLPQIRKTYYVRLAEESPKRNCDEHSDSSMYDSFNCRETDICRDSSDTESNSSSLSGNIETTIKVVEYEVASASSSKDLFTNDSSSGTDDLFLAAFAGVICHKSKCSSDFADTEKGTSDATYDSEFSLADFWVCVKCKNRQNNPMFRYCEKCYQIRKNHFPPRPRLRKSRSTIKRHGSLLGSPSTQRSVTTSEIDETLKKKRKEEVRKHNKINVLTPTSSNNSLQSGSRSTPGRLAVGISQSQLSSTAESSSDEDNTASQFRKVLNGTSNFGISLKKNPYSKYFPSSAMTNKLDEQKPALQLRAAAKRKLSKAASKYKALTKKKCYDSNAILSVAPSDTENETDFVLSESICSSTQGTQKDSGFSSAPSSQERKSSSEQQNDEDEDCAFEGGNGGETSDTVCDELSESDVAEMCKEENYIPSSPEFSLNLQKTSLKRQRASDILLQSNTEPVPKRRLSDILLQSNTEPLAISPLVQSVSECSDAYTNIKSSSSNPESLKMPSVKESQIRSLQPMTEQSAGNTDDFTSYGSCMTCLIGPKNGVFVHSRFLHLCCCYKCAVKIWNKNKKCPICNCAVKNVMKLFVY